MASSFPITITLLDKTQDAFKSIIGGTVKLTTTLILFNKIAGVALASLVGISSTNAIVASSIILTTKALTLYRKGFSLLTAKVIAATKSLFGFTVANKAVRGGIFATINIFGKWFAILIVVFQLFSSLKRELGKDSEFRSLGRAAGFVAEAFRSIFDAFAKLLVQFPGVGTAFELLAEFLKGVAVALNGIAFAIQVIQIGIENVIALASSGFNIFEADIKSIDGITKEFTDKILKIFGPEDIPQPSGIIVRGKRIITEMELQLLAIEQNLRRDRVSAVVSVFMFGEKEGFAGLKADLAQLPGETARALENTIGAVETVRGLVGETGKGGILSKLFPDEEDLEFLSSKLDKAFTDVLSKGIGTEEQSRLVADFFDSLFELQDFDSLIITDEGKSALDKILGFKSPEEFQDQLALLQDFIEQKGGMFEQLMALEARSVQFQKQMDAQKRQSFFDTAESFSSLIGGMIGQREFDMRSFGKWILATVASLAKRNAAMLAQEAVFQQTQAAAFLAAAAASGPFAPLFAARAAGHQVAAAGLAAQAVGAAGVATGLSILSNIGGGFIDASAGGGESGGGGFSGFSGGGGGDSAGLLQDPLINKGVGGTLIIQIQGNISDADFIDNIIERQRERFFDGQIIIKK